MVTTVHNCVQCSHSIQQYNTHKHSSTMLSVCLCNRATICCLYKHFARYNTLRHTHTYYGVGFEFSLTLNSGSNSNSSNTDLKCTQFSGIHNPWHVAACVRDVIVLNWIELSAFLLFSLRLFLFFFLTYPFSYVESHMLTVFNSVLLWPNVQRSWALWVNDFYTCIEQILDFHFLNIGVRSHKHSHTHTHMHMHAISFECSCLGWPAIKKITQ